MIDGNQCLKNLAACPVGVDTITIYVRPGILRGLVKDIVAAKHGRVILNPGTEDQDVIGQIRGMGIRHRKPAHSCFPVLINT